MKPFVAREFYLGAPESISSVISAIFYDAEHCSLNLFEQFDINIPDRLFEASAKRRSDYLAGRLAAKNAMSECLKATTGMTTPGQVMNEDSRMPVFPKGFVGSISHTGNLAVAAVTSCETIRSIGIDMEPLICEENYAVVKCQILTEAESSLLPHFPLTKNEALTVIFSAKESLYKLLYPMVKRFFDFSVAQVTTIENRNGWSRFSIQLVDSLNPYFTQGDIFQGWYKKYQGCILTLLTLAAET